MSEEKELIEKNIQLFNATHKKLKTVKKSSPKNKELTPFYNPSGIEVGIDEAGRGPLFGRVYVAAVILPKTDFDYKLVKDSKRFTSDKKLRAVYEYIKSRALYAVVYAEHTEIDEKNILKTTLELFHRALDALIEKHPEETKNVVTLIIDGNQFIPYTHPVREKVIAYHCIEGGDNAYCSIAAASILAKVERDMYIEEMCKSYQYLDEKYGLLSHKGYGTKRHMDGLRTYGVSEWHRKTFGICKTLPKLVVDENVVVEE